MIYPPAIGEVWYARILPLLNEEQFVHTVLGTPLIFRHTTRDDWEGYLSRHIASKGISSEGLKKHLKHGDFFTYWLEFVFQSYSNHTREVIFAEGLPDILESRPHGDLDGGQMSGGIGRQIQSPIPPKGVPEFYFTQSILHQLKSTRPGDCIAGSLRFDGENIPLIAASVTPEDYSFFKLKQGLGLGGGLATRFRYVSSLGDEMLEVCLFFENNRIMAFDFDPSILSTRRWMRDALTVKSISFCLFNKSTGELLTALTSVNAKDESWLARNISRADMLTKNCFDQIVQISRMNDSIDSSGNKRFYTAVKENTESCFVEETSTMVAYADIAQYLYT